MVIFIFFFREWAGEAVDAPEHSGLRAFRQHLSIY